MKNFYERNIEKCMINFYNSLSEKDKRRYAAVEVQKLGYGGQKYISKILGCDEKKIQQGISDLENKEELKKNE